MADAKIPTRKRSAWLKWLLGIAFVLAALVTLAALVVTVENWRGEQAWKRCSQEMRQRGEKIHWRELAPPPVLDERNFARSALIQPLFYRPAPGRAKELEDNRLGELSKLVWAKDGRALPTNLSMVAWQDFFRGNTNYPQPTASGQPAADVLVALSRFESLIQELRQEVAQRPECRYPVRYEDGVECLLPHLGVLRSCARLLALRATAELGAGNAEAAWQDLRLVMQLADGIRPEPVLISHLVRMAMLHQALDVVREGIAQHQWPPAQLAAIRREFERVDFLAEYQMAMQGERAFGVDTVDKLVAGRYQLPQLTGLADGSSSKGLFPARMTSGWLRQNQVTMVRYHTDYSLPVVDLARRRVYPEKLAQAEAKLKAAGWSPYTVLSRLLLPAVDRVAQKSAQMQTRIEFLRLATALEQFRGERQALPPDLSTLVPAYLPGLPADLITGKAFVYRPSGEGFLLYTSGWDGRDEGGRISAKTEEGDWVW